MRVKAHVFNLASRPYSPSRCLLLKVGHSVSPSTLLRVAAARSQASPNARQAAVSAKVAAAAKAAKAAKAKAKAAVAAAAVPGGQPLLAAGHPWPPPAAQPRPRQQQALRQQACSPSQLQPLPLTRPQPALPASAPSPLRPPASPNARCLTCIQHCLLVLLLHLAFPAICVHPERELQRT